MPTLPIQAVKYTQDGVSIRYVDGTKTEPQTLKSLVELPANEWDAVVRAIASPGKWIEVK